MRRAFWVFSIIVLLLSSVIWVLLIFIPFGVIAWQILWGFRNRGKAAVERIVEAWGYVAYDGSEPISRSYILLRKIARKLPLEACQKKSWGSFKKCKLGLDCNYNDTVLTLNIFWTIFGPIFAENSLWRDIVWIKMSFVRKMHKLPKWIHRFMFMTTAILSPQFHVFGTDFLTLTILYRPALGVRRLQILCIVRFQHVRLPGCQSDHTSAQINATKAAQEYFEKIDPDMEHHSYEEALDCLYSIYKVSTLCASPMIIPTQLCLALPKNLHRQHYDASCRATHCAWPWKDFFSNRRKRLIRPRDEGNRIWAPLNEATKRPWE